jgi:hypothetical protein
LLAGSDAYKKQGAYGVWLATTEEHHQSLRRGFPNMRSIQEFGKRVTGWQVLPADAKDFEEAALRACELVLAGDLLESGKCLEHGALRVRGPSQRLDPRSGRSRPTRPGTRARSVFVKFEPQLDTFVPTHATTTCFDVLFEH